MSKTKHTVTLTLSRPIIAALRELARRDRRSISNYIECLMAREAEHGGISAICSSGGGNGSEDGSQSAPVDTQAGKHESASQAPGV